MTIKATMHRPSSWPYEELEAYSFKELGADDVIVSVHSDGSGIIIGQGKHEILLDQESISKLRTALRYAEGRAEFKREGA